MRNPYLELYQQNIKYNRFDYHFWKASSYLTGDYVNRFELRDRYAKQFSWAVPSAEVVDLISRYSPIVEVGAGTGYWAWLLKQNGADVVAYDLRPPSRRKSKRRRNLWGHRIQYTTVLRGDVKRLRKHSDRALLLCWPPYGTSMAMDALRYHRGSTVIYVGEMYGCTGTDKFCRHLESNFTCVEEMNIPQFDGLHDYLTVWKRNG